jgi:hypothetical protein
MPNSFRNLIFAALTLLLWDILKNQFSYPSIITEADITSKSYDVTLTYSIRAPDVSDFLL